jgi:23S rRNA (pseudouridine1915-N3)-methyltransferase
MKIIFLVTGKTREPYLKEGIGKYEEKISRFVSYECIELPDLKGSFSPAEQVREEGRQMMQKVDKSWQVWLLDEGGRSFTSVQFASFLQEKMNQAVKTLCIISGGPYGFSDEIRSLAQGSVSLSPMTFTHQMVRLIFTEQVYRAFTIIKGTGYHHA